MLDFDESGAVVVDIGSNTTKAGYAGEEQPYVVFPSDVGVQLNDGQRRLFLGPAELPVRRDGVDVANPFTDGVVSNWELFDALLGRVLRQALAVQPKDHLLLLSEPPLVERKDRERFAELAFESQQCKGLYLARAPVLTAFASGKSTAVVLDCGHQSACATPVYDGFVLSKSIARVPRGGSRLSDEALQWLLEATSGQLRPLYSFTRQRRGDGSGSGELTPHSFPGTTPSFHRFAQIEDIVGVFKEKALAVALDPASPGGAEGPAAPPAAYELPDGTSIRLGAAGFAITERALFASPTGIAAEGIPADASVSDLLHYAIAQTDVDVRAQLYQNAIVTGGTSLLRGFVQRVERDITARASSMATGGAAAAALKVIAPSSSVERKCSAWIGGSILGSLGAFQQSWISAAEYKEGGAGVVHRKCP